jgi:PleD family two-component response regulator
MFQRVDEALYEAKEAGRDSVVSRKWKKSTFIQIP